MKKILERHPDIVSRDVTEADLARVIADAKDLHRICFEPLGKFPNGALAMAHVQIEQSDPMRFFVLKNGEIVINPVIITTRQPYVHPEGCMSFSDLGPVPVKRFNLIETRYVLARISDASIDMSRIGQMCLSGLHAAIFQHEIGHFDLDLIFLPTHASQK